MKKKTPLIAFIAGLALAFYTGYTPGQQYAAAALAGVMQFLYVNEIVQAVTNRLGLPLSRLREYALWICLAVAINFPLLTLAEALAN